MTEQERKNLQQALDALNAEIAALLARYGDKIQVRPGVNYSLSEGVANVYVEINTGVEKFR